MTADAPDVETPTKAWQVPPDADPFSISTVLRYYAADPFAVRVVFRHYGTEQEWVFARDLLRRGLAGPSGSGDVHIWPAWSRHGDVTRMVLKSPDGEALVEVDTAQVRTFLDRTAEVVPEGDESPDLDHLIAQILTRKAA